MGVLVDSQFEQRGELLAAEVAAVGQQLLVRPDVLQELIQLLEGLGAGLQHTLVDLRGRGSYCISPWKKEDPPPKKTRQRNKRT